MGEKACRGERIRPVRREDGTGRRRGKRAAGRKAGRRQQVEQQGSDKGRIKKSAGAAGCRSGGKSGGEERVAGQRKVREAMEERGVWGNVAARNGGEQRQVEKKLPSRERGSCENFVGKHEALSSGGKAASEVGGFGERKTRVAEVRGR